MEIQEIFNNKHLNVLQIIFEALAEELAMITQEDKENLETLNTQLEYQYQKLKDEMQNQEKHFTTYLDIYDSINAYYNQKYFKERI
ncbi:MAG: hypothetical protein Q4F88_06490 [Eubacteriales bacterium]|nr:hypothetical protein [Eubacteriales bacterium]